MFFQSSLLNSILRFSCAKIVARNGELLVWSVITSGNMAALCPSSTRPRNGAATGWWTRSPVFGLMRSSRLLHTYGCCITCTVCWIKCFSGLWMVDGITLLGRYFMAFYLNIIMTAWVSCPKNMGSVVFQHSCHCLQTCPDSWSSFKRCPQNGFFMYTH